MTPTQITPTTDGRPGLAGASCSLFSSANLFSHTAGEPCPAGDPGLDVFFLDTPIRNPGTPATIYYARQRTSPALAVAERARTGTQVHGWVPARARALPFLYQRTRRGGARASTDGGVAVLATPGPRSNLDRRPRHLLWIAGGVMSGTGVARFFPGVPE